MEENIKDFLREYKELCMRYNLCLSHEDNEGGFIVDEYDEDNIEWVTSAMDGFELRKRKQTRITEIQNKLEKLEKDLLLSLGNANYCIRDGKVIDEYGYEVREATKEENSINSRIRAFKTTLRHSNNSKY